MCKFIHSLNNGVVPKSKFNLRLAPEDKSYELTGYQSGAGTFHRREGRRGWREEEGGARDSRLYTKSISLSQYINVSSTPIVLPVATTVDIPIIIDEKVTKLEPEPFWLGGGEVLLKLQVTVKDLMRAYEGRIYIADVTY